MPTHKRYFSTLLTGLAASLLLSHAALAGFKRYEAPLGESEWSFKGSPIGCHLNHEVPYYGKAKFSKVAGKDQALNFSLSYKRNPISFVKVASVKSLSADWFPGQSTRNLGEMPIQTGSPIFKAQDTASWKILNELEVGRFPTFMYQEFETREDRVAVSLSTVGFKKPYDKFLSCLTELVPHQLHELKQMTLHFDFDKDSVHAKHHSKLKSLAAYAKYSEDLEIIIINGYADAKGSKGYNLKLSERRAQSVKKLLSVYGADESRFKITAFGERNPVATNRRASGRAKNRRVYLRVM